MVDAYWPVIFLSRCCSASSSAVRVILTNRKGYCEVEVSHSGVDTSIPTSLDFKLNGLRTLHASFYWCFVLNRMNNGIDCSSFSLDAPVVGLNWLLLLACLLTNMECWSTRHCIEMELPMELVEVVEMHGFWEYPVKNSTNVGNECIHYALNFPWRTCNTWATLVTTTYFWYK